MTVNQQMSAAWNGPESAHYVEHADRHDRQLATVTEAIVERARLGPDDRVLDVGCGSGVTSFAAAARAGSVLGVDISGPLTEVATSRAATVDHRDCTTFVVADAQTHDFEESTVDVVISQFGLMFFDDPVGAFTNLHRTLAPGGRIVFSTMRGSVSTNNVPSTTPAVVPAPPIRMMATNVTEKNKFQVSSCTLPRKYP